jgi:multiple sugar transport system permease protein
MAEAKPKRTGRNGLTGRDIAGLLFLAPGVIWILSFTIFPLLWSLKISFTDERLQRRGAIEFIGLQNFVDIFTDLRVHETLVTSVFLSLVGLAWTIIFGTFVAWLFNHEIPGLRAFRTILTMPLFAAPIAVGFLGKVIFNETNGPINTMIMAFGGPQIPWFTSPWWARIAVLLSDAWQWTPFVFIIVLAAMQSISDDLYEAARLDTTSEWMMFWKITFPLISPALGTVALLRLVETFKILDIPLSLTGGGPGSSTQTYAYYTFIRGLRNFDFGYASALAYLLVILSIIISSIYFWRVRDRFEVE